MSYENTILVTGKLAYVGQHSCKTISYETISKFTGGGSYSGGNSVDQILEYNPGRDQWNTIGRMNTTRAYHGVGLVNVDDFPGCQ